MFFGHELSIKYESVSDSIFFFSSVFIGQIFLTMYHVCQTKIVCQSYDPKKLMYQFTLMGPIFWRFISQGQVFGCLGFRLFLNNIQSLDPHFNTVFRGLQLPHLFSEISYQRPNQFISILSVSIFQSFVINEMKSYFCSHLLLMK